MLTEEEETALEYLLASAGSRYLDITRQQLQEGVRKLRIDGRPVPWDPAGDPGRKWCTYFI